jgi:hypothetical protein
MKYLDLRRGLDDRDERKALFRGCRRRRGGRHREPVGRNMPCQDSLGIAKIGFEPQAHKILYDVEDQTRRCL